MMADTVDRKAYAIAFGKRFGRALETRGLTQTEAARRLGRHLNRVHEYCTGRRLPPLDTIEEMIEVLDLDPRILFPKLARRARRCEAFGDPTDPNPGLADEPVESGRF